MKHDRGMDIEAGVDIALRDIVRVEYPDGSRAIGRVVAMYEAWGEPVRVVVEIPGGEWRGLARDVIRVRMDETNRLWRDGS